MKNVEKYDQRPLLARLLLNVAPLIFILSISQGANGQTLPGDSFQEGTKPGDAVAGKRIYHAACAPCHGKDGSGDGPVAAYLREKPRKLTDGVFKFRSTPSGQLPTDHDLYRTITAGLHTTAMPSFKALAPEDRWDVIAYMKTLSPRFSDASNFPLKPIEIGNPVPQTCPK